MSEKLFRNALCVNVKGDGQYPKVRFVTMDMDKRPEVVDVDVKGDMIPKLKSAVGHVGELYCEEFEREGKFGRPWKTYKYNDFRVATAQGKPV